MDTKSLFQWPRISTRWHSSDEDIATDNNAYFIPIEFPTSILLFNVSSTGAITLGVNMIYGSGPLPESLNKIIVILARERYSANIGVTCLVVGY